MQATVLSMDLCFLVFLWALPAPTLTLGLLSQRLPFWASKSTRALGLGQRPELSSIRPFLPEKSSRWNLWRALPSSRHSDWGGGSAHFIVLAALRGAATLHRLRP